MTAYKYWWFLLWMVLAGSLPVSTCRAQGADREAEYKRYQTMADYAYGDGNYQKAKRLYEASIAMPRHEKEEQTLNQLDQCRRAILAQQQLDAALSGKGDAASAIASMKAIIRQNSQDRFAMQRLAVQLEEDATRRLQQGDYQTAMNRLILAYDVAPFKSILYKAEQTNARYTERFHKPMPQYSAFQQKLKTRSPGGTTASGTGEYAVLRRAGDAAFQRGDYATALRKYRAAQQMPGHETEEYLQTQLAKSEEQLKNQPTLATTPPASSPTIAQLKQTLANSPDDAVAKQALVLALTQQGDELMQKQHYADARNRFAEALTYSETPELRTKLSEASEKIAALRAAPVTKPATPKVTRETKPRKVRKPITLAGMSVAAGIDYALPKLTNQLGEVPSRSGLQPYVGLRVLLLPNSPVSLLTGLQWTPGGFLTTNEAGTHKIESFRYSLVQVPLNLRLSARLGKNSPLSLVALGGVLLSRPIGFSYTNYAVELTTTDLTILNHTLRGFNAGLGLNLQLNKRQAIGLMATYRQTGSLLNIDFSDKATNRVTTKAGVSGWGLELVFKFF